MAAGRGAEVGDVAPAWACSRADAKGNRGLEELGVFTRQGTAPAEQVVVGRRLSPEQSTAVGTCWSVPPDPELGLAWSVAPAKLRAQARGHPLRDGHPWEQQPGVAGSLPELSSPSFQAELRWEAQLELPASGGSRDASQMLHATQDRCSQPAVGKHWDAHTTGTSP